MDKDLFPDLETLGRGVALVVSHDAGGAEVLASYVARTGQLHHLVLGGPAVGIFERRLGTVQNQNLVDALPKCDWCLTGTSGLSGLELDAISLSRQAGKFSASFLDHWINFPERFTRDGAQVLPDGLLVGDTDAERIAQAQFPQLPIRFFPNPYFADVQGQLAGLARSQLEREPGCQSLLFVSENLSSYAAERFANPRHFGFTEREAIDYLIRNIGLLCDKEWRLIIRPHPSDSPGKYKDFVGNWPGVVSISRGAPLLEEIVAADIVVGCQSMAMVVALLADKIVVDSIPPGGRPTVLPQKGILHLKEIVAAQLAPCRGSL